jgi:excinuclease ABC subunit C
MTDHEMDDQAILTSLLSEWRGASCRFLIRPRGEKARWLDFALNNLKHALDERFASISLITQRYDALVELLQLNNSIKRMVCFDISHTQGNQTIASCVVFDEKGPCKRAYSYFNIKGIAPGDDYAAMEQAVMRYFKDLKQENWPTLVIIDGGKGQVAYAKEVLDALAMSSIKIVGIAKGPERKAGLERLIFSDHQYEQSIPSDSFALHLLQHIRDEAHRFAITRHRKKREKAGLSSSMTVIPGIGAKRRQALLQRFGGLRELAKASIEEIAKVSGISQALAVKIYQHFHGL